MWTGHARAASRLTPRVEIVPCTPAHYEAFRRLNEAWISRYFRIEPADRDVLDAPQEPILDNGGHILVALRRRRAGGRVRARSAWTRARSSSRRWPWPSDARGLGVGCALGEAAIATARAAGASRLVLESNTVLAPAIRAG